MAYNALNNLIDAYIYANGVQAITGQILNGVLKQMVSQLGSGYHLMGVAGPETVPASNDYAMAYFAATAGEYTEFGGITLAAGEVAVLLTSGNGSWSKQTIYTVPTTTEDLENTAGFITNAVTDLVNYYTKTEVDDTLANYPTLEALETALADYYTKQEIDTTLEDYPTKQDQETALGDYYTKDEMDAALGDRYTKDETDTKLADYYKKTETYDKDEVDSIIAALSRQEYIVAWDGLTAPDVSAIPAGVTVTYSGTTYTGTLAASASTVNKIYMVWNGTAYDMYGTSQDGGYSWVPMGTTSVDLSQYATKAEVSQLEAKVTDLDKTDYSIITGEYGYKGFSSLATGVNIAAAYYFTKKPKDGKILGVKYKAKTGITRFSLITTDTPGGSPQTVKVVADFTNDAADDGKIVFKPLNLTLEENQYLGIRDNFYFGPAQGETIYHINGTSSNYALGFVLVANGMDEIASDIEIINHEIDSSISISGTIASGSINASGAITDDTPSRTLYFVYCENIDKIKVSTGDLYGFYALPPRVGNVAIDGTRHIETLSNTEINIPVGTLYLGVRAESEPIFSLINDGLSQRVGSLEGKVGTMESQLQVVDDLEQEIDGERFGYPGFATLAQLANVAEPYYIAEKPSSGDISFVDVKVGSGTVRILRVTAPQLGGEFTYEIVASYEIPSNLENTVVRIPVNIHLDTDQYIGIQGATVNAWYFGQAEGYVLYRNGGSASNYSAAISIISGGLSNRVDELENKAQAMDVRFVASDISMFENIGFCGDSYTAGMIVVSENPTVTAQNTNLCWGKILERTHGVNSFIYALGGVSVVNNKPTNAWYLDDANCLPKLLSESAKNLYVISLGHNDAYISAYTSKTKSEFLTEFNTNFRSIISQIASHAPNAKIILCKQSGPYSRMGWGADINAKIAEIGADLSLPVLDPANDEYLSSSVYENTMVHSHPTFAGYAGIAKAFDRQFSWATVQYFDYFKAYTGLS